MNSDFNLQREIKTETNSTFDHLKNIFRINELMSQQDFNMFIFLVELIIATVFSQLIQNPAVHILTKLGKWSKSPQFKGLTLVPCI